MRPSIDCGARAGKSMLGPASCLRCLVNNHITQPWYRTALSNGQQGLYVNASKCIRCSPLLLQLLTVPLWRRLGAPPPSNKVEGGVATQGLAGCTGAAVCCAPAASCCFEPAGMADGPSNRVSLGCQWPGAGLTLGHTAPGCAESVRGVVGVPGSSMYPGVVDQLRVRLTH